ncbi:MAG: hypothetical protein GVY22_19070 [Gammaproteobacteria bacterium]|jgi:ornithine cyclodeaminase/alanine dehydrogenase-like protein (mu-crystallin family)|nr:hypothetical protein [Gammaproteobacteria bacterium]
MAEDRVIELLRLADEPCRHIDEFYAHSTLVAGCGAFMDLLQGFYQDWSRQPSLVRLPPKQVFHSAADGGDFRVMPCMIDSLGIQFVKIIGTNAAQRIVPDKISVGKALLLDTTDHFVRMTFDVAALSSFRTAAIAVLAYRLSVPAAESIALVGAGRIGFYTALILRRWLGVRSFLVVDPAEPNRERFETLRAHALPDTMVRYLPFADACAEAGALFLATTSRAALCDPECCGHLRFVASVGADADDLSEVAGSMLRTHQLWTDSRQSMLLGDMRRWRDEARIDGVAVPELRELIQSPVPASQPKPILFISTGVAVQDALVCHFIDRQGR